jgi:hypothetical protein
MARKKRVKPDTIVDAVLESPGASMLEISKKTGLSRQSVDRALKTPQAIILLRERLAAGDVTGNAAGAIGRIVAGLGAITDSYLDDPANLTRSDVDDLTRHLAALVGTLERLARAGIPLDGLASPNDDSAIGAYGLECWARGARWARGRSPARIDRGLCLAERLARQRALNRKVD